MGPWTCSMASRWRSSGVNGEGRRLDFEDGIASRISLAGVCEWLIRQPLPRRTRSHTKEARTNQSLRDALYPFASSCPRADRPGKYRRCCPRGPQNSLASRFWARRIWAAQHLHQGPELFLRLRRNPQPRASIQKSWRRTVREAFWRGAPAIHPGSFQSLSASTELEVPRVPPRTSIRKLWNRNGSRAWDHQPEFQSR